MVDVKKRLVELTEGVLIESDVLGIVEKIQSYDPNLRIQFLDPALSDNPSDPPYRIIEHCRDGLDRIVFTVWELNDLVVERLRIADTQRLNVIADMDTNNERVRREAKRRYRDVMGEANEMTKDILRSPKDTYTVKIDGEVKKFKA